MVDAGCPTDSKMYHTLITGCVRHGDLDAAARLFEGAVSKGPNCLDRETVENTLFMMVRRGRAADLGQKLLEQCDQAGIAVSERVSGAIKKSEEGKPRQRHTARGSH